ncbi:CAP domain-containing protein [Spartinivicinus poritis]|uniref:CAP domain-containing protein n=1 Tax=Spartinivicinus poritis TaxID=2994640 RepID=A0ABT5UIG2_9GAMM|nr:CAP domain-containing protein [Spartinivicinus sp. A2-2]MDE1465223.1 CAP domain-containing protein [Spartinivicinus sp. A2-2]
MKILRHLLTPFLVLVSPTINAQAVDLIQEANGNYNHIFQNPNPNIIQEKLITISTDFLASDVENLTQIKIMLFDNMSITANRGKIIHDILLSDLWVGSVEGIANSSVILAISATSISGKVKVFGRTFFIHYFNGQQLLREVVEPNVIESWSNQIDETKEQRVYEIVNSERSASNLYPYNYDTKLARSSRLHSEDMAKNNYFSHTSRDGRSPFDRIKAQGYQYSRAGENIAAGASTAEQAMELWMNSSGHRAAILSSQYCDIGVGYSSANRYKHLPNYHHA